MRIFLLLIGIACLAACTHEPNRSIDKLSGKWQGISQTPTKEKLTLVFDKGDSSLSQIFTDQDGKTSVAKEKFRFIHDSILNVSYDGVKYVECFILKFDSAGIMSFHPCDNVLREIVPVLYSFDYKRVRN